MDNRKFQAAAIATPPAVEAAPSSGYPTDGNPAGGIPATVPGAAWFHQMGEELRGVIVEAGIVPSTADLSQLGQAIVNYIKFEGITASQYLQYNASVAIPASAAGAVVEFTGATASQTLTLPPKGDVRNADRIEVFNYGTVPVSVAGNGAEGIVARDINFSPIVLQPGDSIVLSAGISAYWFVVGGSALNGIAASFKFSLTANGYQRLPSGLIVQWGTVATSGSADVTVILPIAFPNGGMSVVASAYNTPTTSSVAVGVGTLTSTEFRLGAFASNTAARVANTVAWLAIGH